MTDDDRIKVTGCTCFQGYRGMDRCAPCDGTGSRLYIATETGVQYFPNTKKGHDAAIAKLEDDHETRPRRRKGHTP